MDDDHMEIEGLGLVPIEDGYFYDKRSGCLIDPEGNIVGEDEDKDWPL